MNWLVLSSVAFVGMHVLVSGTAVRPWLISRIGLRAYLIGFSLASALFLGGMIASYLAVRVPQPSALWPLRHVAHVLMWVALMLIVCGVLSPGPTSAGGERGLARGDAATGIHRISRHPFLWGMSLWAGVHLLWNPQVPDLLFYGGFLMVSIVGPWLIDRKRAAAAPEAWAAYAAVTSSLPFAAILGGRNRLAVSEIGYLKMSIATAVWLGLLLMHGTLFRMPVL